jgi:hypothetical protein
MVIFSHSVVKSHSIVSAGLSRVATVQIFPIFAESLIKSAKGRAKFAESQANSIEGSIYVCRNPNYVCRNSIYF